MKKSEYDALKAKQLGLCAICLRALVESTGKGGREGVCVDHNKVTNKVRGLLCHDCNVALGCFHDSIDALNRAIEYLARDNA